MSLPAEIRDRIFRAADDLYKQSGKGSFPRVEDVREAASVSKTGGYCKKLAQNPLQCKCQQRFSL